MTFFPECPSFTHSHVSVFVLEVWLSMITNDPVCVCWRGTGFWVRTSNLSGHIVVQSLEKTLSQVHIANWVDSFSELNAAGNLAVPVSPVVLNAFHVPLVDKDDNFLALSTIDVTEEIFVFLINADLFQCWEENICRLYKPVCVRWVKALLWESLRAYHSKLLSIAESFGSPSRLLVLESFHYIVWQVDASLVD